MKILIKIMIVSFVLLSCQKKNDTEKYPQSSKVELEKENNLMKKDINIQDSVYVQYYSNGNKKLMVNVVDGKYHGMYYCYYENSNLKESGAMVNGLKNGVWKYYNTSGKLDNVAQYYNDKKVIDLDKVDYSFISKNIKSEKAEIILPINWQEENKAESENVILICKKKCDDIFCPNITLTKEIINSSVEFDEYLTKNYKLLAAGLPDFKEVKQSKLLIGNLPAMQLVYLTQINGIQIGGITTWIKNKDTIYIITGMASNEKENGFLKYKGLFQEISFSFKTK